jgi:flagellar hook-associated protein FlgK
MSGFQAGINAIRTASLLVKLAGDNIANASTPGYSAKRAQVVPVPGASNGGRHVGAGSTVQQIIRLRDELVERSLLQRTQGKERLEAEVEVLDQVEMLFGEPAEGGLNRRLEEMFNSLDLLTADPDDVTLRERVVQKAISVCEAFNRAHRDLLRLRQDVAENIEYAVRRVNALTEQIASLNVRISSTQTAGTTSASLEDSRDQLVLELAELLDVRTHMGEHGVVNVSSSGALLVSGNEHTQLDTVPTEHGVRIEVQAGRCHELDIHEGKLGALVGLANDALPGYQDALDEVANSLRRSANMVHSQSLGLPGRFDRLEGLGGLDPDAPVSEQGYGVTAGADHRVVINVENTQTGELDQHELTLDTTQPAGAMLNALRDDLNANVGHVTATVDEGVIRLQAEDGYAFGFATPYDPNPARPGDITAANPTNPRILSDYTGQEHLDYTVTFLDDGEFGLDQIDMQIEVRDRSGTLVRTLTRRVEADYNPGAALELENGLKMAMDAGSVVSGDSFSFSAHASMDTSGVLDALGLNCMFTGLGARNISVAQDIRQDPDRLAGAMHPAPGDNHGFVELAALRESGPAPGSASVLGRYHSFVTQVAATKETRSVQLANQEELMESLLNRRDSVSGVSVDEEMLGMMDAQTIYRGALKYISIVDGLLGDLAEML